MKNILGLNDDEIKNIMDKVTKNVLDTVLKVLFSTGRGFRHDLHADVPC